MNFVEREEFDNLKDAMEYAGKMGEIFGAANVELYEYAG